MFLVLEFYDDFIFCVVVVCLLSTFFLIERKRLVGQNLLVQLLKFCLENVMRKCYVVEFCFFFLRGQMNVMPFGFPLIDA